uniref:Uncharacterized protein n=1 Tax=Arundo donax TaxID=35708 RepID=A0A0A8XU08_ARUDO
MPRRRSAPPHAHVPQPISLSARRPRPRTRQRCRRIRSVAFSRHGLLGCQLRLSVTFRGQIPATRRRPTKARLPAARRHTQGGAASSGGFPIMAACQPAGGVATKQSTASRFFYSGRRLLLSAEVTGDCAAGAATGAARHQ